MIDRVVKLEHTNRKKPDRNIVKTFYEAYMNDISVIPVKLDKSPLLKTWKEYQSRLPTREEMFSWESTAEGVAIVTGKLNGIVILDVDMDKGNGFRALKGKELPPTPVVRTQNGGYHYYFKYPSNAKKVKTSKDILGKDSRVDIRGDGGYALIPYTKGYEWVEGLSPNDVEVAEMPSWLVDLVVDTSPKKPRKEKEEASNRIYSFTCFPSQEDAQKIQQLGNFKKESLLEWYKQEQVAERFLEALGIDKEVGQSFSCVLPGHEESNPSASIYKSDTGLYIYRDWHNKGGKEIFFLPEVYAAIHYKKVVELGKPEFTTWAIRLLVDLGFISQYPIKKKPLPKDVKPTVKKVYEGFCLLLGCKWLYSPGEPTPFSWRFARSWCGVGERQAGEAIKYLLKHGYIKIVSKERFRGRETALFTIAE